VKTNSTTPQIPGMGMALAVSLAAVIGSITLVQYKLTNMWEEVSENV